MKNKLRTLLAFSTIALAGSVVPAFGSDSDSMHINVPFAFTAGKTTLPAGEYVVAEEESGVILIKGARGNAMLLGAAGQDSASEKASVTFDHTDKGYVLKSVHAWGRMTSSVVPVLHTEK